VPINTHILFVETPPFSVMTVILTNVALLNQGTKEQHVWKLCASDIEDGYLEVAVGGRHSNGVVIINCAKFKCICLSYSSYHCACLINVLNLVLKGSLVFYACQSIGNSIMVIAILMMVALLTV
jgi:hypothetical protein